MATTESKYQRIVIIGAGVFGLTTAKQLALEGHTNIVVLDRHVPPVPDGSSVDISRVVRFDYADSDYLDMARDAYERWRDDPKYNAVGEDNNNNNNNARIFSRAPYILAGSRTGQAESWIKATQAQLDKRRLPWTPLPTAKSARGRFPVLGEGDLASPDFYGYLNDQAGWADAAKAMAQLRDECLETGVVSFVSGSAGTVTGFEMRGSKIVGVKTAAAAATTAKSSDSCFPSSPGGRGGVGGGEEDSKFILAAGSWVAGLVDMYGSVLSTGQVLAYMKLSPSEMEKYRDLPIYANFSTGWFNFPPHPDTGMLKMAVHGWGYTRSAASASAAAAARTTDEDNDEKQREDEGVRVMTSSPPVGKSKTRPNFVPGDAEKRLRDGLREILPGLADRPFDRLAVCWYTDSPTGHFIMDHHPDYENLFIAGCGAGHAFKFLPILGEYTVKAFKKQLPPRLAEKWRFRKDYKNRPDAFVGDGSRGGPPRREMTRHEAAQLDPVVVKSKI